MNLAANGADCRASTPSAHRAATRETDHDEQIGRALGQWLSAIEQGEPLARDAFLQAHAGLAPELTECLEALDLMRTVAPQLQSTCSSSNSISGENARSLATLGDFRIIRELGRGGMGVVYEAEQLSLGRRIALKVLPFAAMLDKRQQRRFQNEARTAATLDHPNIVAVHSVGEERGVHYYAMRLVEGQSVAEFIAHRQAAAGVSSQGSRRPESEATMKPPLGLPQSSESLRGAAIGADTRPVAALSTVPDRDAHEYFRQVARLGVQAARALDYAHENGIVHRDIKPANLLLDSECRLYVTDFGLARIASSPGVTMSGDLVGTLRYMSPEQTLAKRVVVDYRTDIYSLGVTLYELLTLRQAFPQHDRQELLRKIAFDEPARLRRLNPQIPAELETIVAKAMEKNAADRFETMSELADDLERYLADKPIQAKPPSPLQVTRKWAKRRSKSLAFALVALFAACIAGIIGFQSAYAQVAIENMKRAALLEQCLELLAQVGIHHLEKGEFKEAELRLGDAYRLAADEVLHREETLITIRRGLGWARYQLDKTEEAKEALKPLQSATFAPVQRQRDLALGKYLLSKIYRENGEHAAALRLLNELEPWLGKVDGLDHDFTAMVRADLADGLSRNGRHAEAEEAIRQAMTLVATPNPKRSAVDFCELCRRGYGTLCDVYIRAGKRSELLAELARMRLEIAAQHGLWAGHWFLGYGLLAADKLPQQQREHMFAWFRERVLVFDDDLRGGLRPLLAHYNTYYSDAERRDAAELRYAGLIFDGEKSFAYLPTVYFDGKDEWTLEAYVTPTQPEKAQDHRMLISSCQAGGMGIAISHGHWCLWLRDGQESDQDYGSGYRRAASSIPVAYGRRQHVAGVWAGDEIRLYIDGELAERASVRSKAAPKFVTGSTFLIGADPGPGCQVEDDFFYGIIESICISRAEVYRSERFAPPAELGPTDDTIVAIDFRYGVDDPTPEDGFLSAFGRDRSGHRNHAWVTQAWPGRAVDAAPIAPSGADAAAAAADQATPGLEAEN